MGFTPLAGTRAPVRVWTDPYAIEPQAAKQLRNIGALPWVQGVAVMPDVHFGKGATVGSVIAMRQAVSPAAVGVDIGCGMSAVRTSLTAADLPDDLAGLRSAIEATIPVGFAQRTDSVDPRRIRGLEQAGWDDFWRRFAGLDRRVAQLETRAQRQIGTLGGGNHFIEVCLEQGGADEGRVWLMLHSGSRNIGKELAERHISGGPRAAAQRRSSGPGPGRVPRRDAGDGRVPAGPVLGAGVRAAQPGGHAGPALRRGARALPAGRLRRADLAVTTTTSPRRATTGWTCW